MYSEEEKKLWIYIFNMTSSYQKLLRLLATHHHVIPWRKWYYEFRDGCEFKDKVTRKQKYTEEQKEKAIKYYFDHGTNATNTIAALGYPSRTLLKAWIDEKFPNKQKDCSYRKSLVEYTCEQKDSAVKELLLREKGERDCR